METIYIENNFDFVDVCEKNIDTYKNINDIEKIIIMTSEILNEKIEEEYRTIIYLNNQIKFNNKIYMQIKKNLL